MLDRFDQKAAELDKETPPDRNRYADFLRVTSILLVVFGHWLVAYVTMEDDVVRTARLLAIEPWTQWLTFLFQVMPVFFFVGGFANAISWTSARRRGESYADWVRRRARRLLWPLVPFFGFLIALVLVLDFAGVETYLVVLGAEVMLLPLWFLAAYMAIVGVAPGAYWLHKKMGIWVLIIALGLALVVDILVGAGIEWVGYANFLWLWGAIHQLGFFWHDKRLPERPSAGAVVAVGALTLLLVLIYTGLYPLSMVGTGVVEERSNDSPPTLALFVLALAQIGVIFAIRKWAQRLLERPRIWAAVLLMGSRMMSVYIWHMVAMILVGLALVPTGIWPTPEQVDATWWLLRVPWALLLLGVLSVLVAIFGRFERPPDPTPTPWGNRLARLRAIISTMLAVLGLSLIVAHGLYDGDGLAGLAWIPLTIFVVGLIGLDVIGTWIVRRDSGEDDESDHKKDVHEKDDHQ